MNSPDDPAVLFPKIQRRRPIARGKAPTRDVRPAGPSGAQKAGATAIGLSVFERVGDQVGMVLASLPMLESAVILSLILLAIA